MPKKLKIKKTEKYLEIGSPYHPSFPPRAKRMGGKWMPGLKVWRYNAKDEKLVEEMYLKFYGYWKDMPAELQSAKVTLDEDCSAKKGFYFGNSLIASWLYRAPAKLGENVVMTEGEFLCRPNGDTKVANGVSFIVRDIPKQKMQEEILSPSWPWSIELLEENIDIELLQNERARLLQRIAEIDKILNPE